MSDVVERAKEMSAQRQSVLDAGCPLVRLDEYNVLTLKLAEMIPELVAEAERLHSWDGLMSLLDEHYPEDVFPTLPDDDEVRDRGPRIISLIRRINEIRRCVA